MFHLNIHKLVGSKSARQFLYPLSFFKQKRNIAESNIPLGMFPFSIGLQKFKVHFPKRQEQQIGRTSQLMHDEHAALTKHFARVSHQKIELDILGEISGYDAIKFSLQNHLFCSSMNKFDIGQFPSLFSRNAQIFPVEFHACNAALGQAPCDFTGQSTGPLACSIIRLDVFGILLRILRFQKPSSPKVENLAI